MSEDVEMGPSEEEEKILNRRKRLTRAALDSDVEEAVKPKSVTKKRTYQEST